MKKRYIIAFGLMFLIYMSACGNYINAGVTDNKIYLYGLIDFLIVSAIMIAIPLFFKLLNKINEENGKKICRNNSLIIFILSILATSISEGSRYFGIGGLGAILYYFINMNLFVQETNHITKTKKNINDKTAKNNMQTLKSDVPDKQLNNVSNNINYKNVFVVTTIILGISLIISIGYNVKQYLELEKSNQEYISLQNQYDNYYDKCQKELRKLLFDN